MLGAIPLVIHDDTMKSLIKQKEEKEHKISKELNNASKWNKQWLCFFKSMNSTTKQIVGLIFILTSPISKAATMTDVGYWIFMQKHKSIWQNFKKYSKSILYSLCWYLEIYSSSLRDNSLKSHFLKYPLRSRAGVKSLMRRDNVIMLSG